MHWEGATIVCKRGRLPIRSASVLIRRDSLLLLSNPKGGKGMHLTSLHTELAILSPASTAAPQVFRKTELNRRRYDQVLADMQRLRGSIYLRDGAIQADELTADGRHKLAIDERSWHILLMDGAGSVKGCLRYLEENDASRFDDLSIRQSALTHCPVWGGKFRRAVELEMARAALRHLRFGSVGGWAVAEDRRCTTDPLRMVLATCGLFRLLGGCIGLATATVRHCSAGILRRIGLTPLTIDGVELPSYWDPRYQCQMEALRFDSDLPSPKYARAIDELSYELGFVPVISREGRVSEWCGRLHGIDSPAPVAGVESNQSLLVPVG